MAPKGIGKPASPAAHTALPAKAVDPARLMPAVERAPVRLDGFRAAVEVSALPAGDFAASLRRFEIPKGAVALGALALGVSAPDALALLGVLPEGNVLSSLMHGVAASFSGAAMVFGMSAMPPSSAPGTSEIRDAQGLTFQLHVVPKNSSMGMSAMVVARVEPLASYAQDGMVKVVFEKLGFVDGEVGLIQQELFMTEATARDAGVPVSRGALSGPSPMFAAFRVAPPSGERFNPFFKESSIQLGDSWFRRTAVASKGQAAAASFRGVTSKYGENQDRLGYAKSPEGLTMMIVFDGAGGYGKASERAAEIGRVVMQDSWKDGQTIDRALLNANEAVARDNRIPETGKSTGGVAVMSGFIETPDGHLKAITCGDAETVVFALPDAAHPRGDVVYWSLRPIGGVKERVAVLADGRVAPGYESWVRLDPDSSGIGAGIGMDDLPPEHAIDDVRLEPGRTYLALAATDGFTEQFLTFAEIGQLVTELASRHGITDLASLRDHLMIEALMRSYVAETNDTLERPVLITPQLVASAYAAATNQVWGQAQALPPGFQWKFTGYWIAGGAVVHPNLIDAGSRRLRNVDLRTAAPGEVVGHFKADNISFGLKVIPR